MIIYVNPENYMCSTTKYDEDYLEVETNIFDGKCAEYIEGYRFIPSSESWTRSDGVVFYGEMVAPWMPYSELDRVQREYEREILADAENALAILLGGAV